MSDLHAGKQYPIGASFATRRTIYPALIGGDIGCGMSMYELHISAKDVVGKEKKIAKRLTGIEGPWTGDMASWLSQANLPSTDFDSSLGTVGRGNHFAEIQVIETIYDHYIKTQTPEFEEYINARNNACTWALKNRELIARRIFETLGLSTDQKKVLDIWHNNVQEKKLNDGSSVYLHRKGAAPSDQGIIVVPGSRGALTYLVLPLGDQQRNAFSIAHGAGRALSRTKALEKSKGRYGKQELRDKLSENSFGGVVICDDLELLCEEAPEAYKDVNIVVQDLVDAGIVKVIATFKPRITYKMRED